MTTETMSVVIPPIGTRIKAQRVPGVIGAIGREGTIIDHPLNGQAPDGGQVRAYARFIDADSGVSSDMYVTEWEVIPDTRDADIARLKAELLEAQSKFEVARSNWFSDIRAIGSHLAQQAVDRDWCSDYEEQIANVSLCTPQSRAVWEEATTRTEEVEVTISGYVRVPFTQTVTVTKNHGEEDYEVVNTALEEFEFSRYDADFDTSDAEVDGDPEGEVD